DDPASSARLAAVAQGEELPWAGPRRRAGIHPDTATGHLAARLIRVGGTAPPAPRAPAAHTAGTPAGRAWSPGSTRRTGAPPAPRRVASPAGRPGTRGCGRCRSA